jgi:hypothetical protein
MFVSYSHDDDPRWLERIQKHLNRSPRWTDWSLHPSGKAKRIDAVRAHCDSSVPILNGVVSA